MLELERPANGTQVLRRNPGLATEIMPGSKLVMGARPQPAAPRAIRTRLAPFTKLTRAHLSISQRPAFAESARETLAAVAGDLGKQLGVAVSLNARLADATLHPFSHLSREAMYALFELGQGRAKAVLEIDWLSLSTLLRHAAGAMEASAVPTRLTRIEQAALGWLLLSALCVFRGNPLLQERFEPRLLEFTADRTVVLTQLDGRQRHLAVELSLGIEGQTGAVRLLVPALLVQSALETVPPTVVGQPASELLSAAVEARCFVGVTKLSHADATRLAQGDVVVFRGASLGHEGIFGAGRLLTRAFELRGTFAAEGFSLSATISPTKPKELNMSEDPTLPVELEVELTRVRLPLSHLATLRSGALIPLHINGAQPVTVRIGDRAVAKAELVDIEGELGARILSLV